MIVIDASVWLSAILPTGVHYTDTVPWRNHVETTGVPISVPAHFIAEVAGVLSRIGLDREFVANTLDLIESERLFTIYPISAAFGRLCAEVASVAAVRGSDAIYLALAQFLDVPLLTWDRQQRERGSGMCRTMTPVEVMELYR